MLGVNAKRFDSPGHAPRTSTRFGGQKEIPEFFPTEIKKIYESLAIESTYCLLPCAPLSQMFSVGFFTVDGNLDPKIVQSLPGQAEVPQRKIRMMMKTSR